MMEGMEGPHLFEIVVTSNDPEEPQVVLQVKADFEPGGAGHTGDGGHQ